MKRVASPPKPRPQSDLAFLSIEQAAALLRRKQISPVDLVNASLSRIERLNPLLNAFITVVADRARREARAAEREIARGKWKGPLHGIPVALKDNIFTRGIRTTVASKILANFVPNEDADVVKHLASAGAILLGKTNLHEFAYGITNENPHFGSARNPWNREHITGGSTGGSSAALASGLCFGSVGTDTGGSLRVPPALCGIVGLKPTFGLVSVEGIFPLALSLDHAGPLARRVSDVCILLEALAGAFPKGVVRPDYRKLRATRPKRFRIGWPSDYYFDRIHPEVRALLDAAAKVLCSLGGRIEKIPMPRIAGTLAPVTNIALAEAAHYHESQGFFPARASEYGDDVRYRLEQGSKVRAVDYIAGLAARVEAEKDFQGAFERVDVILAPSSAIPAPLIGQAEVEIAGEKETVRSALVRLNRPVNFTGHPAMSVPCGFTRDGLPVGMQLIGPRWSEARLLTIAYAYEQATEWHTKHPDL
ncbi:MAG TPA: amidase [Candidatus Limnocylindrales bacterium]|nr:amidase [Candidatus Limnocylindrales bacterium]